MCNNCAFLQFVQMLGILKSCVKLFILKSVQLQFVVLTLSAPHHGSNLDGISPGYPHAL